MRIALDHLDEVITLIRSSQTADEAREGLIERFSLTHEQAQAILDMRLQRLTGLERDKIEAEYEELMRKIAEYRAILADEQLVLDIIYEELEEIKQRFGDERRTEITASDEEILDEDLIPREEVLISITHSGYVKRLPVTTYRSQKRGGRGVVGMDTKENDFVEHLFVTNSHHYLLIFTNKGKVYRLKAYEVPELGRTARGTPIINLIQIEQGETINAVIPVESFNDEQYLFFATKHGIVKKTPLSDYINIRKVGLIAISLREEDDLIDVRLTDGTQEIILGTSHGMSIRFSEKDVRSMGRSATGVKGIQLVNDDTLIGMDVVVEGREVLVVTANGYGKRTPGEEYRPQNRGGIGIKTIHRTEERGLVVALKVVDDNEDLMIMTASGTLIRMGMEDIKSMKRDTMGVKLINTREDDFVSTVTRVEKSEEESEDAAIDGQVAGEIETDASVESSSDEPTTDEPISDEE